MRNCVVAAAVVAACAGGVVAQTTIYETGFESPPFSAGNLQGQDGYQAVGPTASTGEVQSAVVKTGAQAVRLDAGGTAPRWFYRDTPFAMGTGGQNVLIVSWDMQVSATATPGQGYGIDLYSLSVDRYIGVFVDVTGELVAILDNDGLVEVPSGAFPSDGEWHSYQVVLDFDAETADVWLDGAVVIDDAEFNIDAGTNFNDADLWALPPGTNGNDVAYYDNLSIVADDEAPSACYADCDQSTGPGMLDIFDFLCFQNAYDQSDPYACNCDLSTGPNNCDIFDFLCFQNAYDAGCP